MDAKYLLEATWSWRKEELAGRRSGPGAPGGVSELPDGHFGGILGPSARKRFTAGYQGDTRALRWELVPVPLFMRLFNQTEEGSSLMPGKL